MGEEGQDDVAMRDDGGGDDERMNWGAGKSASWARKRSKVKAVELSWVATVLWRGVGVGVKGLRGETSWSVY